MRMTVLPSALLVLPLLFGGAPPEPGLPLPPAREGIVFEPGTSEVTLAFLLSALARSTGQELALNSDVRREFERTKVKLESAYQVPPEEVYSFVEGLLAPEGVVIAPLTGGKRPVLGVWGGTMGRAPAFFSPEPMPLSPAQYDEAARHPVLLVRTVVVLEHIDARQLQTQLRQLLVDPSGNQNVVPAGERALLVQGRAAFVVGLARQLQEVDAAAGRGEPVTLPMPSNEEGAR